MHNSNMTEKLKIASFISNAHCGDKNEKYNTEFHTKIQIKLISDIQDNKYNVKPLRFNRINSSS